jgi:hypothetical protein
MKTAIRTGLLVMLALAAAARITHAQETIKVPLSDPDRPARLKATVLTGSITVKAHNGREILVEGFAGSERREKNREGLRRIGGTGSFHIAEENNVVTLSAGVMRPADLVIQVPPATSLSLRSTSSSKISVEGVSGEIDVNNLNGAVYITNVSGSVVAHTLNGKLVVSLEKVAPDKAMSFSTLNGDIDVTLPADIKADFKMKSDNGEIYSDFDVTLKGSSQNVVSEKQDGKTKLKVDRSLLASVNGGGPLIQFTTFNGDILIRKRK